MKNVNKLVCKKETSDSSGQIIKTSSTRVVGPRGCVVVNVEEEERLIYVKDKTGYLIAETPPQVYYVPVFPDPAVKPTCMDISTDMECNHTQRSTQTEPPCKACIETQTDKEELKPDTSTPKNDDTQEPSTSKKKQTKQKKADKPKKKKKNLRDVRCLSDSSSSSSEFDFFPYDSDLECGNLLNNNGSFDLAPQANGFCKTGIPGFSGGMPGSQGAQFIDFDEIIVQSQHSGGMPLNQGLQFINSSASRIGEIPANKSQESRIPQGNSFINWASKNMNPQSHTKMGFDSGIKLNSDTSMFDSGSSSCWCEHDSANEDSIVLVDIHRASKYN